jgi:hypothetical protein
MSSPPHAHVRKPSPFLTPFLTPFLKPFLKPSTSSKSGHTRVSYFFNFFKPNTSETSDSPLIEKTKTPEKTSAPIAHPILPQVPMIDSPESFNPWLNSPSPLVSQV